VLKGVVVAPAAAIQQGPAGPFVYMANDDNTVSVRPVTTGQSDGERTVITAGLKPGEQFVTTGFSRLKEGAKISTGSGKGGKPDVTPDAAIASPSASSAPASGIVGPAAAAESSVPAAGDSGKQGGKQHRRRKAGADGVNGGTSADAGASPPAVNP